MYGHQIRRTAEMINVEAWSDVRAGSLYHALHQLDREGLIEAVRTEQEGRLPARTIYAITPEGQVELGVLRERGLREISPPRDPFDVALWVAAGRDAPELEFVVRQRLEAIRLQLEAMVEERERLGGEGAIPAVGLVLMRHGEARLEAELRWHEELLEALPELGGGSKITQA